jgi:hypothetical protein
MSLPIDIRELAEAGVRIGPLYPPDAGRPGVCSCRKGENCHSPAKHPLTEHGKDDFTANRWQLQKWAEQHPGCNWGGRPPEGVIVLDVDPRNGGYDSLTELESRHGPLPATLTALTGGGGMHFWFVGGSGRGSLGKGLPGLDVKTHTGYLVLPPSIHASGKPYTWDRKLDAAYQPQWLWDLLNPPVRSITVGRTIAPVHLIRHVMSATEDRNRRLYWAARRVLDQGGDPRILTDAGKACGLSAFEVRKAIDSALKGHGGTAA